VIAVEMSEWRAWSAGAGPDQARPGPT
jgi:hypothetical protein